MDYLPVNLRLAGEPCLVVGGGEVALRKVRQLRAAGAAVTVVAPALAPALATLAQAGDIRWQPGRFAPESVGEHLLVVAATDEPDVNLQVADAARRAGRFCNVVDDAASSTFISPAVVDRSPLLVAVSTGGQAPALARLVRQQLDAWLPRRLGELAGLAGAARARVRARWPAAADRRRVWEWLFTGPPARDVLAGRGMAAQSALAQAIENGVPGSSLRGEAYLVGAGPGEPELLTLRARRLLAEADVVLHDRLVSADVLALARRDAALVDVGKAAGQPSAEQAEINALLIERVRQGQRVCRLKGGDPFMFGRGGEEALALAAAGLRFEVVPGITAASGCAAYAGIPLTHRGLASAVTFVSAQLAPGHGEPDWATLARLDHTLVFYMPTRRLEQIARSLVAEGKAATTPAALIWQGTTDAQRQWSGSLRELGAGEFPRRPGKAGLLIVGPVVALADALAWFAPGQHPGPAPLVGPAASAPAADAEPSIPALEGST